jgi:hypothetical protein
MQDELNGPTWDKTSAIMNASVLSFLFSIPIFIGLIWSKCFYLLPFLFLSILSTIFSIQYAWQLEESLQTKKEE